MAPLNIFISNFRIRSLNYILIPDRLILKLLHRSLTLKMEAVCFSEAWLSTYQTTRRRNPEDHYVNALTIITHSQQMYPTVCQHSLWISLDSRAALLSVFVPLVFPLLCSFRFLPIFI
jgi:hypothetical protein